MWVRLYNRLSRWALAGCFKQHHRSTIHTYFHPHSFTSSRKFGFATKQTHEGKKTQNVYKSIYTRHTTVIYYKHLHSPIHAHHCSRTERAFYFDQTVGSAPFCKVVSTFCRNFASRARAMRYTFKMRTFWREEATRQQAQNENTTISKQMQIDVI